VRADAGPSAKTLVAHPRSRAFIADERSRAHAGSRSNLNATTRPAAGQRCWRAAAIQDSDRTDRPVGGVSHIAGPFPRTSAHAGAMTDEHRRRRAQEAFEPVARLLAGRRWFPLWAVVHHRGRRSGTEYATPVAVVPTTDKTVLLIGLPWGKNTNWARNVVAADGTTLRWKGRDLRASAPRIVDATEAATLAKRPFRSVVRRMPGAIVLKAAESS
jgi:deazaflavin-dependent oxidoreductase (nitroreductase family)